MCDKHSSYAMFEYSVCSNTVNNAIITAIYGIKRQVDRLSMIVYNTVCSYTLALRFLPAELYQNSSDELNDFELRHLLRYIIRHTLYIHGNTMMVSLHLYIIRDTVILH